LDGVRQNIRHEEEHAAGREGAYADATSSSSHMGMRAASFYRRELDDSLCQIGVILVPQTDQTIVTTGPQRFV
jgi:hypothetical protein